MKGLHTLLVVEGLRPDQSRARRFASAIQTAFSSDPAWSNLERLCRATNPNSASICQQAEAIYKRVKDKLHHDVRVTADMLMVSMRQWAKTPQEVTVARQDTASAELLLAS